MSRTCISRLAGEVALYCAAVSLLHGPGEKAFRGLLPGPGGPGDLNPVVARTCATFPRSISGLRNKTMKGGPGIKTMKVRTFPRSNPHLRNRAFRWTPRAKGGKGIDHLH